MKESELIKKIAGQTELTQTAVSSVINALVDVIGDELKAGEKVRINDFGTFESREMQERTGRNPRKPEDIIVIPAQMKPAFKPSKKLKEKVNE